MRGTNEKLVAGVENEMSLEESRQRMVIQAIGGLREVGLQWRIVEGRREDMGY